MNIMSIGFLLDYYYVKNHYRLIAVDLSRQKVLDLHQKAIRQIEFPGQLENLDNNDGKATDTPSTNLA